MLPSSCTSALPYSRPPHSPSPPHPGPHNHLFSDLNFGLGTRPFASGGDPPRGAYAGSNNTFWNLRATQPSGGAPLLKLPACDFGPQLNFIGR